MKQRIITLWFFSTFLIFLFVRPNVLLAMTKYKVQSGDTMWKIALNHQVDFNALLTINKQIDHPELIYPGQMINIPKQGRTQQLLETDYQQKLLSLINKERRKLNLRPLSVHPDLSQIAEKKAKDMLTHKYVAHNSPTYGNPTDMLKTFNIRGKTVYENVGAGPSTSAEMFNTWLNSQVTRSNMLTKRAEAIGIGCVEGGRHHYYWTLLIVENLEE